MTMPTTTNRFEPTRSTTMNARVIGKQRGQAMSEFVVAMIAFVPLVLGVIYIGKYSDIKHQAIQASRYAAFERALDPHKHEGGTTVQDETVARFFRDGGQHTIGFQDKATGSTRSMECGRSAGRRQPFPFQSAAAAARDPSAGGWSPAKPPYRRLVAELHLQALRRHRPAPARLREAGRRAGLGRARGQIRPHERQRRQPVLLA
ncbi:MAG: pilus assembly protein [Betaproteobacteria bacterium]|nr:MAG: pilus assembly protein [Betaproteobacteria bacterium]